MEAYVERQEFETLKKDVEALKIKMDKNADFLHELDKKLDVIIEKIGNNEKNEEIKLEPINTKINNQNERIEKIESALTWLWRAIGTTIIGLAFKIIFDIAK
jgi:chromosome segregation ATPase